MEKETKQPQGLKCDNIEEYTKLLLMYFKQECALQDDRSYWDVSTSNMDGTLFGEKFDHGMRIAILKKENPDFAKEVNEEELKQQAREEYQKDLERANAEASDSTEEKTE